MRSARIPSLVLMHLGMLAGCKPSATATTTTTATATASTSPPVPSKTKLGAVCQSDSDCGGYYCALGFNGASFTRPGHCVEHPPIYEGRPLMVDGAAHVAAPIGRSPLPHELTRVREAALEEHASIAAFARTICELMALGAPSWLVEATSRALADEVRHAAETFAWLERLGGGSWRPGLLASAVAPLRQGPTAAAELYRDVFRGGAIGETLAAMRADEASNAATSAELAAFHASIAEDEARHAALAFRTLQWLESEFPELAAVRAEELATWRATSDTERRALLEPLMDSVLG